MWFDKIVLNIEEIMGIKRNEKGKGWTEKEITFLYENYKKLNTTELSQKLNRPRYGVYQKLRQLGIYENRRHYKNDAK